MNLTRQIENGRRQMGSARRRGCLRMAVALALVNGFWAAAQPSNAPAGTEYSSFRIIAERNIFDPNRYPHAAQAVRRTTDNRVPAFSLVGTMTYKKGMLAFFDGTDADYRKILAPRGMINGYTVVEITLRGVRLESAGKTVEMKVGAQMRQEAKGEWQLAEAGELPAATVVNETPATGGTPAAGPASGSDSEPNDVLKKLMQQREQELK
ncbi:MAG: hypothetical protein WAO02_03380 [Verrucomicrobiia bacterium]